MYLLRPHRGSLSDSMTDLKTFETKNQMLDYVNEDLSHWIHQPYCISVKSYDNTYDDRIDWNYTDIVLYYFDGHEYVWGFCTEKEVVEDKDAKLMRDIILSSLVEAKNKGYDDFATAKYITDRLKEYNFKVVVF